MATPTKPTQNSISERDLRESYDAFMREHDPERLRNYGAIMDLPYAMLLPEGDDPCTVSFRMLFRTREGNGLVPATLHVETYQMSNFHFEPHSRVSHFMDDSKVAKCRGVFGHVSLGTDYTYHVEGHGYGYPDWSTTLTAEQLSARVAEPDERWYRCLMYDVMDAQEKLQSMSSNDVRTPIATSIDQPEPKSNQPSL